MVRIVRNGDNFDQSDECCFSNWEWSKNRLPERSVLRCVFFPQKGSNEIIPNYFSHIHAVSPLFVRYLPILNMFSPSLLLAFDRSTPCHLPPLLGIDATPRLRTFFQLSQNLVAIDQEVASLSREWSIQTTGNVGLLHKQMENGKSPTKWRFIAGKIYKWGMFKCHV